MPAAHLDTNAFSDLMRHHVAVKRRVGNFPDVVSISAVVMGEIRFGLERLPTGKKRDHLEAEAIQLFAMMPIEKIDSKVADLYGQIQALLEAKGINPQDNDLWIAATALSCGALLVTRDQGFLQIPGLVVEDWSV